MESTYMSILVLFSIVALGFILAKRQLFTKEVGSAFAKFVINFSLPADIFIRLTRDFDKTRLIALLKEILLPLLTVILLYVIAFLVSKLLKVNTKNLGAFILCFVSPSAAFLGIPIIMGIYGDVGLAYALLCYMVTGLSTWTIGILIFNRDARVNSTIKTKPSVLRTIKQLISPPFLGFVSSGIVIWFGWHVPEYIKTLFGYIGGTTSPLAMLYIGIALYQIGFKRLKITREVIGIILGRYVIAPIVVILLCQVIKVPPLMGAVCLIWASLPVSNTDVIIAGEKNVDISITESSLSYSLFIYLAVFFVYIELIKVFF